jgi:hypothetical protein
MTECSKEECGVPNPHQHYTAILMTDFLVMCKTWGGKGVGMDLKAGLRVEAIRYTTPHGDVAKFIVHHEVKLPAEYVVEALKVGYP